jgi:hypothetical protein
MKHLHQLLLLLSLSSCGIFRNSANRVNKEHTESSISSSVNTSTSNESQVIGTAVLTFRDSVSSDYLIQLWPKGVFTYSQDKGFAGEAERVLIRGKTQQSGSGNKLETHAAAASSSSNTVMEEKEKLVSDSKQTEKIKSVSWKSIVPLLLLGLVSGWLIIRFIIKKIWIWKI